MFSSRSKFKFLCLIVLLLPLGFTGALFAADYQPDRDAVLNHLNAAIRWYRDSTSNLQAGNRPSDAIFATNAENLASQALSLAFDSARAEAALFGASSSGTGAANSNASAPAADAPSGTPNYSQLQARYTQTINDNQERIDALDKQIASASASMRQSLQAQRDALAGEIDLDKAIVSAIQKMANFADINNSNTQSFLGSINALAESVPEVLAGTNGQKPNVQKPVAVSAPALSTGLLGELGQLYDAMENLRTIDRLVSENRRVRNAADALRQPLISTLRATIQQGQAIASRPSTTSTAAAPPSASAPSAKQPAPSPASQKSATAATAPPTTRAQFKRLTQQFDQLSAALVPLSEEIMVLDESRSNLTEWRLSISSESKRQLFSVLTRVIGIALALGVILFLSELWRRLTFRYVTDPRRRRQFLVMRRLFTGFFMSVVVILGFVSEFSSLATYAGFVTAGIAVGLQTLLLSVAAYFFVIGRYGIRVGDRISVAGVTGDVIDVGLVRFYIMEMAGLGIDLQPTGRIAVFSNSVLFQPTVPLYKQVPGTEYAWHEVALSLVPGGDHQLVQQKALAIVKSEYEQYREDMERQTGYVGNRMEITMQAPAPESSLQLDDAGFLLVIRYPVNLRSASKVDSAVVQRIMDAINSDEALKKSVAGTPRLRAPVKA